VAAPDPPRASGPAVHLVGIYPEDGCGVGTDPDCTVPTNATLTLRFDRFLNPATVSRQAIRVYTGDPALSPPAPPFQVTYDPIERVVEYRMPAGHSFAPHTLYQLELVVPRSADDPGIRAFDGAALAEAELPLHGSFFTGDDPTDLPVPSAPTCDQVVRQVFLGTCTGQECHQKGNNVVGGIDVGDAPYGLWLDDPRHLVVSAIGRVARQTELGDESGGTPLPRSPRFGVRMALIDPRNPGSSYLMYKLLRNLGNFEPCPEGSSSELCAEPADPFVSTHPQLPLPEGESFIPTEDELARLREWFVLGAPMPRPSSDGQPRSIYLQGLRAVSTFIASGADCK
jgi:hypothetical protein